MLSIVYLYKVVQKQQAKFPEIKPLYTCANARVASYFATRKKRPVLTLLR